MNFDFYTACFCEENSYHLVKYLQSKEIDLDSIHVIFVSNKDQKVVFFEQKAAQNPGNYVIWVIGI
jgi:hypothetical protein